MLRGLFIGVIAWFMSCSMAGCADAGAADDKAKDDPRTAYGPDKPILKHVDKIEWRSGPASLEAGAQYAVLEGDPSASGMFVMRLKLPDGFIIRPHTHPNVERVTVLSGTFNIGHGSRFDRDAAHELPAGSFTCMPPGMQHYAFAKGETVVQLTSIGPWEIHYLDPEDDPRLR